MKLILIDESIIECQAAELNEGCFITNDGLLIPAEHVTEITDNTPECLYWDKQVGTCRRSEVAKNENAD
jgi:hypothetical protein